MKGNEKTMMNERMTISFDMDGTISNFYGVDGWLDDLINFNTRPYREAKPLVNMSALARQINRLQKKGYFFEIISWCSKAGNEDFDAETAKVKMEWLEKHLPSVHWDKINIVPYGVKKSTVGSYGILFDDEKPNRDDWDKYSFKAYDETKIFEVLRGL